MRIKNYSMKENIESTDNIPLTAIIEALLFVSSSPISINQIFNTLNTSEAKVKKAIIELQDSYVPNHGLMIQMHKNKIQLTTTPYVAKYLEGFMGIEVVTTLSQASLEALAIIAYRQPITRPEIDSIRGVNSDGVLRNLLSKGLIEEVGRVEGAGRPIIYGTTSDFLSYFGISSLNELPAFDVLPGQEKQGKGILKD